MNEPLKDLIKAKLPGVVLLWRQVKHRSLTRHPPVEVFSRIFREKGWGDADSASGPGSSLDQTEAVRRALPLLMRRWRCSSFLDIPCGDFFWMQSVELDVDYIGADIVEELVERNRQRYGDTKRTFLHLDLLRDKLPRVDILFCRDCLVHLSYQHIRRALENIRSSRALYLLTTTFRSRRMNEDIPTGLWRPLNLQRPPFCFPSPLELVDEECPTSAYRDKSLGLWRVADLPTVGVR